MLTPRLKEKDSYDQIMQWWLISTEMDADEQELPQLETEEASAQPSIILLEKLAVKMDKLEVFVEKSTTDIAVIKANQQIIIDLLTHR